ncbi:MAG: hypothetical protein ACI8SN_002732, partial [Algoriphagus sp.]
KKGVNYYLTPNHSKMKPCLPTLKNRPYLAHVNPKNPAVLTAGFCLFLAF